MFIEAQRTQYPVSMMCRLLNVSSSGYYQWQKRKLRRGRIEDRQLLEIIRFHFNRSKGTYGYLRITAAIRKEGLKVNKKKTARIMKANDIQAKTKKKFRKTTNRDPKAAASENLLKQNFTTDKENKIWTSDITYLRTNEGWLYLAIIMDIFSRRIIGWSIAGNLSTELILKAFKMAVINRNPSKGIIFHSDRGSRYTSSKFRNLLNNYGFIQSMSSTGNCYDNAITESFFHTLKTEHTYWHYYKTRQEAKQSIFEFIEVFYNRERLHSASGFLSPVEFEEKSQLELFENVA